MRPPRDDIGAPEFRESVTWIGGDPGPMTPLAAAGPVLVHFVDLTQLNSVRTLPYLREWFTRYSPHGLSVIAVQAPRHPFGAEPETVAELVGQLGLEMPVAIDTDRSLWHDYGCEGWPSLFLWSKGGALRWFQFGEGEYRATEEAIQEEIRSADALRRLPEPMAALRPADAPGATVIPPTPELFPAGDRPWTVERDCEALTVEYESGGAHVTAEGAGSLELTIDGAPIAPIAIAGPGLYSLVEHDSHGHHTIDLRLVGDVALWSVSFSAGTPPPK